MEYMQDLTNKKFGRLTAIKLTENPSSNDKYKKYYKYWLCECECGNNSIVKAAHLLYGTTKSCGCNHKRKRGDSRAWKGYEEISGEHFGHIIKQAKDRGITFNITIEYAWELYSKQNKKCALTGLPIEFGKGRFNGKRILGNASLDRIDNGAGYEVNNVRWVHKDINLMKRTLTDEQLISYCKLIVEKHENRFK